MDQSVMPRSMLRAKNQAIVCPTSRKIGYRSARKAQQFAERSRQILGRHLHVYKCADCDHWHLTSQGKAS